MKQKKKGKVIFYQDDKGGFRWRFKSSNGNIIADSAEGYTRLFAARNGFYSMCKSIMSPNGFNEAVK